MIQNKSKKHHKIVPILFILICLPLALMTGFLVVASAIFHDEKPPDDRGLILSKASALDVDNAYIEMHALLQLQSQIDYDSPDDKKMNTLLNGGEWDESYVQGLTAKNIQPITLWRAAATKTTYLDPFYANPQSITWENSLPEYVGSPRVTARIVALEAMSKARSGDIAGGLQEAMDVVRVGQLLETGRGSLIDYLVGSSTKQIGLSAIRQIALTGNVPTDVASQISTQLDQFRDSSNGLVNTFKLEYTTFRGQWPKMKRLSALVANLYVSADVNGTTPVVHENSVLAVLDDIGATKYYYMPNQNQRFAVEQTREWIASSKAPCTAVTGDEDQPVSLYQRHGAWAFFEPNAIGKYFASIGQVAYGGLSVKRCNEPLAISATQVALAMSANKTAAGPTVTALTDLVPAYYLAVPLDSYNEQPLKFRSDTKSVYSVGPGHTDVGGSPVQSDWQNLPNPSFQVIP